MGFLAPAPPRTPVTIVETGAGKVFWPGGQSAKSRIWIMADRSVVICVAAPGGGINRIVFEDIESAVLNRPTHTTLITLEDQRTVTLDARGCGCGMGAVGSAGPIEGPYEVQRQRADWYTIL